MYESDERNYEFLMEHQGLKNAVVRNRAIGPVQGTIQLKVKPDSRCNTIIAKARPHKHGYLLDVQMDSFVDVVNEFKPTMIKCDIEGTEWDLPWEKVNKECSIIAFEIHYQFGKSWRDDLILEEDDKWSVVQNLSKDLNLPGGLTDRLCKIWPNVLFDVSHLSSYPTKDKRDKVTGRCITLSK